VLAVHARESQDSATRSVFPGKEGFVSSRSIVAVVLVLSILAPQRFALGEVPVETLVADLQAALQTVSDDIEPGIARLGLGAKVAKGLLKAKKALDKTLARFGTGTPDAKALKKIVKGIAKAMKAMGKALKKSGWDLDLTAQLETWGALVFEALYDLAQYLESYVEDALATTPSAKLQKKLGKASAKLQAAEDIVSGAIFGKALVETKPLFFDFLFHSHTAKAFAQIALALILLNVLYGIVFSGF
jgi:hypothetical protein